MTRKQSAQKPKGNNLFTSSLLFIILSLLSGALNYLYYPVMARVLSVSEFGASQTLIVVLTQAGAAFAGLSLLTIYLVKTVDQAKITQLINSVQKLIVSILITLTILLIVFHPFIASYLNITDNFNLFIVAIDLIVSIPFVISFGYLLAKKRFIAAALLQISVVITKLIVGTVLALRFDVYGSIAGIGLGYIIGMLIFWLVCKITKTPTWDHNIISSYSLPSIAELHMLKTHFITIGAILLVSTCLVIYPSFDVVIARHHLSDLNSSFYAAASTLSSVILFACLPFINLLLPQLNINRIKKSSIQIAKITSIVCLVGVASTFILLLIPDILLSIFGEIYTAYSSILWVFGINMLFVCLLNIFLQILVLYRPRFAIVVCLLTIGAIIATTSLFNTQALHIINSMLTVYSFAVIACIISLIQLQRSK